MNLKTESSKEVATSMIVSGSTVALVGGILIVTKTWAFSAMLVFGLIVAILGAVNVRRLSVVKRESEDQSSTDSP